MRVELWEGMRRDQPMEGLLRCPLARGSRLACVAEAALLWTRMPANFLLAGGSRSDPSGGSSCALPCVSPALLSASFPCLIMSCSRADMEEKVSSGSSSSSSSSYGTARTWLNIVDGGEEGARDGDER